MQEGDTVLLGPLRRKAGGRVWKVPATHGVHCLNYRKSESIFQGKMWVNISFSKVFRLVFQHFFTCELIENMIQHS